MKFLFRWTIFAVAVLCIVAIVPDEHSDDEQDSHFSSGNINDILKAIKGIDNPHKFRWSSRSFINAIKRLGLYNMPGLKVVKLKREAIRLLERIDDHVYIKRRRHFPKQSYNRDASSRTAPKPVKRQNLYNPCEELVDSMFVLAHQSGQYAYEIKTVRCQGNCASATFGVTLGECVLKEKKMVVYVLDGNDKFVPKTITPGCACQCHPFPV